MTSRPKSLQNWLPALILACSLSAIYLSTLAPGLSWANDGSDGGDLIAAAATNGNAHPTGYPLYLILARIFQFLPVGSLAWRTNLMSALATVCAAVLIYEILAHSRSPFGPQLNWLGGMTAGYAFGLAPLVWSQAVITEVYALQALLTALIVYLYIVPDQASNLNQKWSDRWRGLVLGLALGNHLITVLLLPAALVLGSLHSQSSSEQTPQARPAWFRKVKFEAASLGRQLVFLVFGLFPYLLIPLRALSSPPVNWGNAVTPARFWWLVSARLYQSYYLRFSLPEIWERIHTGAALLLQQFGWLGIMLGLVGLVVFGVPSRLYIFTIWIAALYTAFAIFYGSADSYVYLIPMLLSFAIWAGIGTIGLAYRFTQPSSLLRVGFGLLVIGYFLGHAVTWIGRVNASRDFRAESFGREVLSAAPQDAIIFAKGDQAVFALWYFHFALHERPDLTVLAVDLLHFDWYQENLRATYPSLVIPGPFPWPETIASANSSRPVCYARYSDQTEMDCSPSMSP